MAVEIVQPYSEAGLAGRNIAMIYLASVDAVRAAKGRFLDFVFDNPGHALLDHRDKDMFGMLNQLHPKGNSLDLEDSYRMLVKGLEADGDLRVDHHGEADFPMLTRQSLGRIAEMRRRYIDTQVSAWEREIEF